jgi:hypothetical protein
MLPTQIEEAKARLQFNSLHSRPIFFYRKMKLLLILTLTAVVVHSQGNL